MKFQGTDRRQDGATPLSGDVNWADLPNAIAGLIATPVNQAFATASTGGTLVAATYYYRVSAINAYGETVASVETSQIVGAGTSTNTVTVNWLAIVGATGYKVYGRTTGAELLIATVTGQAIVTYVDTGALVPAGALPVNTANPPQTIEVSVPYWIRYNIVTLGTGVLTATLRGVQ